MRLKPFIIFLVIFTVLNIVFFIIKDKLEEKKLKKKEEIRILSIMDSKLFHDFSSFYGVSKEISKDILFSIYQDICKLNNYPIENYSMKYQLENFDFIVVLLFFEYYQVIDKRKILLREKLVQTIDYNDQNLLYKYGTFFLEKKSYQEIINELGNEAVNELKYLDEYFLIPGIRIIDSNIHYVGGAYEKK